MLPLAVPSGLAVRRTRTEDGFRDDPVAVRQLEVIPQAAAGSGRGGYGHGHLREGQMVAATFMIIWASKEKPNVCGFPH